jgi:hypothetical protein
MMPLMVSSSAVSMRDVDIPRVSWWIGLQQQAVLASSLLSLLPGPKHPSKELDALMEPGRKAFGQNWLLWSN